MAIVQIKVTAPTKAALADALMALQDRFMMVKVSAEKGEYSATFQAEYPEHEAQI